MVNHIIASQVSVNLKSGQLSTCTTGRLSILALLFPLGLQLGNPLSVSRRDEPAREKKEKEKKEKEKKGTELEV